MCVKINKPTGITVNEMSKLVNELVAEGKGDYQMMIDVNEHYKKLVMVQVVDESESCGDKKVNVL